MKRKHVGRLAAAVSEVVLALGVTAPAAAAPFTPTQSCEVTVLSSQQSEQVSRFGGWGLAVAGAMFGQHYSSVQTAVTAAQTGDTLLIRGTCTGITTIDKNLTLIGEATGFGLWGVQQESSGATLDGQQSGPVLTIDPGLQVTIEDLTITGGQGSEYGGGIFNDAGTVTLSDSRIAGNSAFGGGGGIYNDAGSVTINDGRIEGNSASEAGGGIYNGGGSRTTLNNSRVDSNSAYRGGGISNADALTLNNSRVDGNSASEAGGGIFSNGGALTLNNSRIEGNSASDGGGIANGAAGTVTIMDSRIEENCASDGGGIANGSVGTINIEGGSTVDHNTATSQGGGIYNDGGTVTLSDSRIAGNSAYQGGGIYNHINIYVATVSIEGTGTIDQNTATDLGGGIYNDGGTLNGAIAGLGGNVYDNSPDNIYPPPP